MTEPLIYELSKPGRRGYTLPRLDVPELEVQQVIPAPLLRSKPPALPEVSENEVVRHFVRLSSLNYHVDRGFYPLGSCTMKYNPKINEDLAKLPGFTHLHPLQPEETVQGALALMHALQQFLAEIAGVDAVTLQPAAGAHAELTGILLARKYHEDQGKSRSVVLVPDSAHGTNPASVTLAGYEVRVVRSTDRGTIDLTDLERNLSEDVAVFMVTNPNTLGLFEEEIVVVAKRIHEVGALMYMDGANLNALLGKARPGDMGFDIVHFNLHKTFSTPHGGGGPGAGAIGVMAALEPYLPVPRIEEVEGSWRLTYDHPKSIGKIHGFYGNFLVMVRAYAYIRMMGPEGLERVAEDAVLNANYLMERLKSLLPVAYPRRCMHEFVLTGKLLKKLGVRTLDIAKRLLDYGFHAPTIYFPLIVPEALMIEPTETETKETLDAFVAALQRILKEAEENPELLRTAPHTTPVRRLDEAWAARHPNLRYTRDPSQPQG